MKPENLYILTRSLCPSDLSRMERQISGRSVLLKVKEWEIESLKCFYRQLERRLPDAYTLAFYYSFQIPKLGKEFDLLRITEASVLNIELKSMPVSDDTIRRQLQKNRYYLQTLGRVIRSYTYISEENRLVRLTGSGRLAEDAWEELCDDLQAEGKIFEGDIETLFRAEDYLFSPLADPDRFLREEYFLTSQQRDIERKILNAIRSGNRNYLGVAGLPGTGKSLMLYDLALKLSRKQKVCVVHCGAYTKELSLLNERLKRIDFVSAEQAASALKEEAYTAVLVDEAHRMNRRVLDVIVNEARVPVVFTYDVEDMISDLEIDKEPVRTMEALPEFVGFRMTNRIRTNAEISGFMRRMLHNVSSNHKTEYTGIQICYAGDALEAERLLELFRQSGYQYLSEEYNLNGEFDKVVLVVDERYYYDEEGYLRVRTEMSADSSVRNLFFILSRAREKLALIVRNNREVLDSLLTIVQGPGMQESKTEKVFI